MTKWFHRSEHSDGPGYRFFDTEEEARVDMAKAGPFEQDPWTKRMIDNYGGTHSVGKAPPGVKNGRTMLALERAFDARECGTLTKAQQALLERHYF